MHHYNGLSIKAPLQGERAFFFGLLFLACLLLLLACEPRSRRDTESRPQFQEESISKVEIAREKGPLHVSVRLARTAAEIQRGLMYVDQLPRGKGMLFLMPREEIQYFWMKNTLIPLDMIFINEKMKIVGIVERAEPLTTTTRTVGKPSRYVLELRGGYSAEEGIKVGQSVRLLPRVDGQD